MTNPHDDPMDLDEDEDERAEEIAGSRSYEALRATDRSIRNMLFNDDTPLQNRGRDRYQRPGFVRPLNIPSFLGFGNPMPQTFRTTLQCYSVAMMSGIEKQNVENGGKIILPPRCLELLTQLNTTYPMLFKISNGAHGRSSHCGVLEFTAEEGMCFLPYWMMQNLLCGEGDPLSIESVSLPVATFSKFQPQSTDFLDISNPKAMLENALRHFACLTTGETIAIRYNDKVYDLKVLETKPREAVQIIECDMDVDFAPPVGYVEPVVVPKKTEEEPVCHYAAVPGSSSSSNGGTFGGVGQRLDGKEVSSGEQEVLSGIPSRGVPDYDYEPGTLSFVRDFSYFTQKQRAVAETFEAFAGQGKVLRSRVGRVQAED